MHLKLSDDEVAFREEMRTFFTTEIPKEIRERTAAGTLNFPDDMITVQRILNEHGLAVPKWPSEWGGRDWTPVQKHIWQNEMNLASVPEPLAFNTDMVGPVIANFGSQEIKERFLPATANLDIWWCQASPSPRQDPTWHRSRPVRFATATTMWSTVRRPGPPWPSTPTGSSRWCAPTPMLRSARRGSASCSST